MNLTIWDILEVYRDLDESGMLPISTEPPISVIQRDLDLAEESYYIRRKWDPSYTA